MTSGQLHAEEQGNMQKHGSLSPVLSQFIGTIQLEASLSQWQLTSL